MHFEPKPKKRKPVREKKVEASRRDEVNSLGGWSLKFVSPGTAGVPDRQQLWGVEPMALHLEIFHGISLSRDELVALLASAIEFEEMKRPGGKCTPHQERIHARLRALGFTVNVVDQVKAKP